MTTTTTAFPTPDTKATQLEALTELMDTPGWQVLMQRVRAEWGPEGRAFVRGIIDGASNDADTRVNIKATVKTQESFNAFFGALRQEVSQWKLGTARATDDPSRRGGL